MRAVVVGAVGIVALMCGGCAGPSFDLVSRDPESPWLVGDQRVRTESSLASVNTAFNGVWLDHLIFEVEVVNQSDSTLVVDPEGFTYTLSSSGKLPKGLKRTVAAAGPDAVVARLDKAIWRQEDASFIVTALVGLTIIAAVALGTVEFGTVVESVQGAELATVDNHPDPTPAMQLRRARESYVTRLLRRVELSPGESVRGEVWLPAGPVVKAMGPIPSQSDVSITATPPRKQADHGLTLRTPAELGGQEIDFSVAPAW
jgi:hypothetical protein